jgi:hypothetical protein
VGNRSRYVAVGAAAAGAVLVARRRRNRLRRVADGIRETILPTHVVDLPTAWQPIDDEAHAPGHRHLAPGERQRVPRRPPGWGKHGRAMRRPYTGG